ncbi:MAG: NYN domain-containing protein [bacterium]|nr:NYN domain-containing protein [bacterium]
MNILIVDGYNIINQWTGLKKELQKTGLPGNGFEYARNELIEIMAEYRAFTGDKVVIVFDGYRTDKSQITKSNELGIEVIFSKRHQTADSVIERLAYKERGEGKTILVATKDTALERIIIGLNCFIISPQKLKDMVKRVKADIKELSYLTRSTHDRLCENSQSIFH